MQELTAAAMQSIRDLAQRYGTSEDAVRTLLYAVSAGGGSMAQFYHQDLGGGGQWMRGGMTMVGDMFNSGLQARVSGICSELSSLLASQNVFVPLPRHDSWASGSSGMGVSGAWWPSELGSPSSSGGQNDSRYAYFPDTRRLAILENGRLSVYDTLDHWISGVQQQQGGSSGSLSFSSQFGTFSVASLPLAPNASSFSPPSPPPQPPPPFQPSQGYAPTPPPAPAYAPSSPSQSGPSSQSSNGSRSPQDILTAIERLGDLHRKGVLTDSEFQTKKAELLAQL
jgi:hypothetical protein